MNKGLKWNDIHIKWALDNKQYHISYVSFVNAFNVHFGTNITQWSLRGILRRGGSNFKVTKNIRFTKNMNEWLEENYPTSSKTKYQLVKDFNSIFKTNISADSLISKCNDGLHLKKVNIKEFIGNISQITQSNPIGSEYIDKSNGYTYVKVNDIKRKGFKNFKVNWELKQRYMYKKYHNVEIPNECMIIFADGNRQNFEVDNLLMVTRREYMRLISCGYNCKDKEIVKSGLACVKLSILLDDMQGINAKNPDLKRFQNAMKNKQK